MNCVIALSRDRERYMWQPISARTSAQWLAIAGLGILAGCDDHHDHCFHCVNLTPTEFSNGVFAADFNGDGFADVVALSTVSPGTSARNSSALKTYLTTGAGAFAPPTLTSAGSNPLYLASA